MTDTELLIRDCLAECAEEAELTNLVPAAVARSRQLARNERVPAQRSRFIRDWRPRHYVYAASAVVVLLMGTIFVVGASQSSITQDAAHLPNDSEIASGGIPAGSLARGSGGALTYSNPGSQSVTTGSAPGLASGNSSTDTAPGRVAAPPGVTTPSSAGGGVAATRVVKTGSIDLTVAKGKVAGAVAQLTQIATSLGGYVSASHTSDVAGSPSGEVTVRMPVARFDDAVTAAEHLGHQTSLTTNAHDITGKYVDLSARLNALQRTRSTYLTILSRARTIGQTLSVQQRVEDVQSQIEQLQGELKVLRNQSSDGTLTVDVAQAGSPVASPVHHPRKGFAKAWHTSISRFNRGIQAFIGALGPLLIALILIGLLALAIRIGMRRSRRTTSEPVVGGAAGK